MRAAGRRGKQTGSDPCPPHPASCILQTMSDRAFVFGVDLDGVVADFYGGLRPIAAEWLGVALETLPPRVSWGLKEWGVEQAAGGYDKLHRFAVTQRQLFLDMPPIAGAPQTLRRLSLEGVRIRIITPTRFNPNR